jgi:hypothetical protein
MLLIGILQSCQIRLSQPVIEAHPDLVQLEPITANHAAEAIASLWKGIRNPRNSAHFWVHVWNMEWNGYARLECVPENDATGSAELKKQLEKHPIIQEIVPADGNPFIPGAEQPP